ncbi:hypothetical protein GGR61_001447 [Xanthomonas arboricola]|nr:hypothetical protein [Xanthomonas sp. 3075]MBB5863837.1 hypothetical protein [Xanthomonas sp. 3058]
MESAIHAAQDWLSDVQMRRNGKKPERDKTTAHHITATLG